jgi:hypothetical protein
MQKLEVCGVDNGPAANAPVNLTPVPVYDESGVLMGYTQTGGKEPATGLGFAKHLLEKRPVLTLKRKGKDK